MIISIEEFLRNGKFGPIDLGVSKGQALTILGEPDCDTDLGETGSILLYAWYELFFNNDGKLHSIQNDNYDPADKRSYEFKNNLFEIEPWFLNTTKNQSITDISNILDQKGLEYDVIDYYGHDALKLKSGVVVDFDEEENECGVNALIGIRYWP
jgi:hypothetical protein